MDALTSGVLANAGAASILAVTVVWILRGRLIPSKSLDAMLAVHERRLAELKDRGDEWREVALQATERAAERDKQTERLLEVVNTTVALMETLRQRAAETGR